MIRVQINGIWFTSDYFVFSGGEVQTKLNISDINWSETINVKAKLHSSNDIISLLQVNDILQRQFPEANIFLNMAYAPYARQDRACAVGESLACKVFANLINSCEFSRVYLVDCHSDVLPALLNKCVSLDVAYLLKKQQYNTRLLMENDFIISPDAGANKKVFTVSQMCDATFVRADKTRDPVTGSITGTEVYHDDFEGKPCLIVDDICDGGYTFVKLAEKLKEKNAGKITLFVTHGIFSKGIEVFDNLIDEVWTTDSFNSKVSHSKLHIVKL